VLRGLQVEAAVEREELHLGGGRDEGLAGKFQGLVEVGEGKVNGEQGGFIFGGHG
jgi:hypothetical protein